MSIQICNCLLIWVSHSDSDSILCLVNKSFLINTNATHKEHCCFWTIIYENEIVCVICYLFRILLASSCSNIIKTLKRDRVRAGAQCNVSLPALSHTLSLVGYLSLPLLARCFCYLFSLHTVLLLIDDLTLKIPQVTT